MLSLVAFVLVSQAASALHDIEHDIHDGSAFCEHFLSVDLSLSLDAKPHPFDAFSTKDVRKVALGYAINVDPPKYTLLPVRAPPVLL